MRVESIFSSDSQQQHKHVQNSPKFQAVPSNPSFKLLLTKGDGVGISQLFRCDVDLLVGDRREEGNHVVVSVVTDGRHLVRVGGVSRNNPPHPLVENGIGESVEHLWGQIHITGLFLIATTTPLWHFTVKPLNVQCVRFRWKGSIGRNWI